MQNEEDSPFEDNMLRGELVVDAWLVLHSNLTPEEHLDIELAHVKKSMLEMFYRRFPGQLPTGGEDAKG